MVGYLAWYSVEDLAGQLVDSWAVGTVVWKVGPWVEV